MASYTWPTEGGGSGGGNVVGPLVSVPQAIATYADASGEVLLNTDLLLDGGNLNPPDDANNDSIQAQSINFTAANKVAGTGDGGDMEVSGGNSLGGNGGDLDLSAGEAQGGGNGGAVNINSGNSASGSGSGGDVNITASTGPNADGVINFYTANTLQATLDASGNLTGPLTSIAVTELIMTSTQAAASGVGTLTNLPTGKSGNPTGYLIINVNGTNRFFPFW